MLSFVLWVTFHFPWPSHAWADPVIQKKQYVLMIYGLHTMKYQWEIRETSPWLTGYRFDHGSPWKAMPGDLVIYHLPTEMHPEEESTIITISVRTVKAMPSAVVHKKIADRCGCSSPLKYCSRDFDPAKNGSKLEGWNGLRTWGKWYQCDNVSKKMVDFYTSNLWSCENLWPCEWGMRYYDGIRTGWISGCQTCHGEIWQGKMGLQP